MVGEFGGDEGEGDEGALSVMRHLTRGCKEERRRGRSGEILPALRKTSEWERKCGETCSV